MISSLIITVDLITLELEGQTTTDSIVETSFSSVELNAEILGYSNAGQSAYEIWLGEDNTGTEQDFLDTLKGEKGDRGEQGIQGIKGDQGIQGLKGDTGSQGIQGLTGPQGATGLKGDKGDRGEQGLQGLPGINGQDGYTPIKNVDYFDGTPGLPGPQGDPFEYEDFTPEQLALLVGPQGEIGPQGPQGIQGIAGTNGTDGDTPYIENNYWYIDGVNTNVLAIGQTGADGDDGRGISTITKTSTNGLVDTYTITYTDDTTSTFDITNGEDGEGQTYTLPTATTTVLGGVKVDGTTITITDGVISGSSTYTLPTASAETLGGVKVGTRLTITDGVLSADVQTTDISGKQDTLVSGTNIKTINDTSLLGSGNITISGGSGSAITNHSFLIPPSGGFITTATSTVINQTFTGTNGEASLIRFTPQIGFTTTKIGVVFTTTGGGKFNGLVFDSDSNGRPTDLLATSTGTIDNGGGTGYQETDFVYTFTAGKQYWVGLLASVSNPTIRAENPSLNNYGIVSISGTTVNTARVLQGAYTLTNNWDFSTQNTFVTLNAPVIFFKV
jgi:hypothetical protein